MMTVKCLLAGLLAAAILAAPANAHENVIGLRHAVTKGNASAFLGRGIDGIARTPGSHIAGFAMPPHGEPGGVCDPGDNAMVC